MLVTLTAIAFAAGTLATQGIFHRPIAKPAFEVELLSGLPYNITVPGGDNVAIVPNRGGKVSGAFNGEIIGNLTGARETLLPSEDGEYTRWEDDLVFVNANNDRVLVSITGTVTYANEALHGFGYATFKTTIPSLQWTNYAMFVTEWMADFYTGTGQAEIFHITTGGRLDGEPIDALLPPREA